LLTDCCVKRYCSSVKETFAAMKIPATVVELDTVRTSLFSSLIVILIYFLPANGSEMQSELTKITGGHRTVPMVFINGKFIGGCDGKCY